jgi:hypothetical protein
MYFGLGKMAAVQVASLFIHRHYIATGIPYIPGGFSIGGFAYPVAAGIVGIAYGVAVFCYCSYFTIYRPANIGNAFFGISY